MATGLDASILAAINNVSVTTVNAAVTILRADGITDPTDIATYLASSTNPLINPNGPNGTGYNKTTGKPNPPDTTGTPASTSSGSGTSLSSLMGLPTGVASIAGMAGLTSKNPAMAQIGTGILAAIMQYEVFDRAEKATEDQKGANIAMLGGLYLAAVGATMLWLSKLSDGFNGYSSSITNQSNAIQRLMDIIKHGHFSLNYYDPGFWPTVAVAVAVTSAVLAAGVLAAKLGGSDAPIGPTGAAVNGFLSQIPDWADTLPSSAVMLMTASLTLGGMSYSLTPGTINTFSVPTVTLSSALEASTGNPNSTGARIFVQKGTGANAQDTVYYVTPGADGNSTVTMFNTDTNGYLVGKNGPDKSYKPFATPQVDGSGKAVGITMNMGALNAILQIPLCMAIANDTNLPANTREANLETCLRNNKDVQFVPL